MKIHLSIVLMVLGMMVSCCCSSFLFGQASAHHALADSIRLAYALPAVGYAIVSTDGLFELDVVGVKKLGSTRSASPSDKFRIGSNTKAITGYLAGMMVDAGLIRWETKFFDIFPTWKGKANEAYHKLTFLDLLSFRTPLPKWSYMNERPRPEEIQGTPVAQRLAFGRWAVKQKPVPMVDTINGSNLGYVLACLMLEQVFGATYEEMIYRSFYRSEKIEFGFGAPNADDSLAIWGHDTELRPEAPGQNVRLNWLMAAGNLNISLFDYAKVMRRFLWLLQSGDPRLSPTTARFLCFGLPEFAVGWFWGVNAQGQRYAHNLGNPGTFLCRTMLVPEADRAYIVVSNCMTDRGYEGTELLMERISG